MSALAKEIAEAVVGALDYSWNTLEDWEIDELSAAADAAIAPLVADGGGRGGPGPGDAGSDSGRGGKSGGTGAAGAGAGPETPGRG